MLTKEQMQANFERALDHMSQLKEGKTPAQLAAKKIARAFEELGIPYVVAGGLAVAASGLERTTEDVNLIMTKDGLEQFKERWLGVGWVERSKGSKSLNDAEYNLRVDILNTTERPGDGKSVSFKYPTPNEAKELDEDGVSVLTLERPVELKIATGMTVPKRPRDLDDAIQLVEANRLPRDFAAKLHAFVRAKYDELWLLAQTPDPKPEA